MDWSKIDAALAGALAERDDPDRRFVVFVHLDPTDGDVLDRLGVEAGGTGDVRTATVSGQQAGALTDQAGVLLLRLSTRLRPTEEA